MKDIKKNLIIKQFERFKNDFKLDKEVVIEHDGEYYFSTEIGFMEREGGQLHLAFTTDHCPACRKEEALDANQAN